MRSTYIVATSLSVAGALLPIATPGCGGSPSSASGSGESALHPTTSGPSSAPPIRDAPARFEAASAAVGDARTCSLHPENDAESSHAIPVTVEEDGIARFYAVRPTVPGAVERLVLDCVLLSGASRSFPVDLRADETFAPRPFDAAHSTLELRPALDGDPLRYTREELLRGGYGLRPDPVTNPGGYSRWLATATIPLRKLRSAGPSPAALHGRPSSLTATTPPPNVRADREPARSPAHLLGAGPAAATLPAPELDAGTAAAGNGMPWTGAVLLGSQHISSDPSQTQGYGLCEATFNVPNITPGRFSDDATAITIWNGLDNVFQAIVDVDATSTAAAFGIHRQIFEPVTVSAAVGNTQGTRFTPRPGDSIFDEEWYCDADGNVNMTGGYACSFMADWTQGVSWVCDEASSTDCQPFQFSGTEGNGSLGFQADFVVENDTGSGDHNWPDFSQITMTGSAMIVQGSSQTLGWVTPATDPGTTVVTDWTRNAAAYHNVNEDHVSVFLGPSGAVNWLPTRKYTVGDYDGDGTTDFVIWRPSDGHWYEQFNRGGTQDVWWGEAGDVPVPGDYDGDGLTDRVVWRPSNGTWYVTYSSGAPVNEFSWGVAGDVPVPGDYDGDGRTDTVMWEPSDGVWKAQFSSGAPRMETIVEKRGVSIALGAIVEGSGRRCASRRSARARAGADGEVLGGVGEFSASRDLLIAAA